MRRGLRFPGAGGGSGIGAALLVAALLSSGCVPEGGSGGSGSEARRALGSRAAAGAVPRDLPHGQELPDGVTRATIGAGERIFSGEGFCHNCHGRDGRGIRNLGSDLTDGSWDHTDGSYPDLVRVIGEGVKAERTASGLPTVARSSGRE